MPVSAKLKLGPIQVPESYIFGYPSKISNLYEPFVEKIVQSSFEMPEVEIDWEISKKASTPEMAPTRTIINRLKFRESGKRLELGNKAIYDARVVFNGNMAHLVQHHLASLGFLLKYSQLEKNDVVIVIGNNFSELPLKVFNLAGFEVVKTDRPISGNLIQLDIENAFYFLPFIKELKMELNHGSFPSRILLARRDSRRISNLSEVDGFLKVYGFETLFFEEMPVIDQFSVMASAQYVVGIHGAALGCLAFNLYRAEPQSLQLIELFGAGFVVNPFRKYMAQLGGTWVGCRGKLTGDIVENIDKPGNLKQFAHDDFEVSLSSLEMALEASGIPG